MPTFRFYVDKKIVRKGQVETGGEHSRVVDLEAVDEDDARSKLAASKEKLAKDEVEGQLVSIQPQPDGT
jgi:hypothetical protein